jgi:4-hydroxybenzoate polyprenyltransferase
MGLARMLVYVTAAAAGGWLLGTPLLAGAVGLFAYVVGLTYAAKQEALNRIGALWPLAVLAVPIVVALARVPAAPVAGLILAALALWMAWALRLLMRRGPGDVPRAVVALIAGIALYDAALIATTGATAWALAAVGGFALTLALQRVAPGT